MVLDQAKEFFNSCKMDHIDGMHCKAISDGTLDEMHTGVNFSETYMNNAHGHILASLRMLAFIQGICNNLKFIVFYNKHKNPERIRLHTIINNYSDKGEEQMQTLMKLTAIFKC
eukprot:4162263-Ditylum_brightwellii.AAC.1